MFRLLKEILWKLKTGLISLIGQIKIQRKSKMQSHDIGLDHGNLDRKLVSNLQKNKIPHISQLKHLPRLLNKKEKNTINFLLIVIFISLGILGYKMYVSKFQVTPVSGGEYTEGLLGAPRYINPLLAHTNDVDLDLSQLIFSGLLKYDTSLHLVEDLAESYTVSDDQKTYTFILKKNIFWHDGAPVSADDIIFTYESIQNPNFKSTLRFGLRGVKVQKNEKNEIIFTLNEPYPTFTQILTTGILPEHIWGKIPAINSNLTEYNLRPIGSGPWKFKNLSKDGNGNIKTYILEPFENYYGTIPYIKKFTFKFFSNFDSGIEAINNRTIEGLSYISKDKKDSIKNPNIKFYSHNLPQYTAVFFNQKNNDLLKDKEMRKALSLSVDKTKIFTDALKLQGEIIHGPILPGFSAYNLDTEDEFDPQAAKDILNNLGWKEISYDEYQSAIKASALEDATNTEATSTPVIQEKKIEEKKENTQSTVRKKGESILKFKLTTANIPEYIIVAEIIKNSWQNIGIEVELEIISEERVTRDIIKTRNYEVFIYGENYGSDPDPYPFWHSSQIQDPGLNLAIFSNRKIDKILEDAQKSTESKEKDVFYAEFEKALKEEYPAIFLYTPTYIYGVHEKIHIPTIDRILLPHDRFIDSEKWYIDTGRRWKNS